MRSLKPRQRSSDGVWHFTSADSKGNAYPVGFCSATRDCPDCNFGWRPETNAMCEPCGGTGVIKRAAPCEGHPTAEEACQHYNEYLLSKATFVDDHPGGSVHECIEPGCTNRTNGYAQCVDFHVTLCVRHRTKDTLKKHIDVHEIWQS